MGREGVRLPAPPGIWITELEPARGGRRLAVKDLFDTAGVRTTYGSAIFADHVPTRRAEAVARLEAAGYVNVGKANLHEFAWGITSENPHYGTVPNPLAPGRIAGGSSGGNAAALAPGSPTRRSAPTRAARSASRPPAAASPASSRRYGLVPLEGCFPLAPSFDHAGPMARDVADVRADDGRAGRASSPPRWSSLGELTLGLAWTEHADPLVRDARRGGRGALPARSRRLDLPLPTDVGASSRARPRTCTPTCCASTAMLYGANVPTRSSARCRWSDAAVAAAVAAREPTASARRADGRRRPSS